MGLFYNQDIKATPPITGMYLPYFTTQRHELGPFYTTLHLAYVTFYVTLWPSPSSFSPEGELVSLVTSTSGNLLAHNTDSGRIWTSSLRNTNNLSLDRCPMMIIALQQEAPAYSY